MISTDIPLVELHRHLDGSIRLSTILELGLLHNLPLPAKTLEGLRPYVQVSTPQPGVMKFIEKFEWMTGVLVDYAACRRVAYENVEDAYNEGLPRAALQPLVHGIRAWAGSTRCGRGGDRWPAFG